MKKIDFEQWLDEYGARWRALDADGILDLMDKVTIEYRYDPFKPPFTTWEQINSAWQGALNNQKDVLFDYEIIMIDQDKVLTHVKAERTLLPSGDKETIDGAFLFGFSKNGKCNYFKQWRVVK